MIDIPLFQDDEPLRFERIVFYPYPDLQRVWARLWLTAKQDTEPNVDITILNPDGSENTSIALLTQGEQRIEKTLHLRNPQPGATYRVVVELSVGVPGPDQAPIEQIERQAFEMPLEFRNPEAGQPGFGTGVDWEKWRREQSELEEN